jgi:inhibitor of KinA
MTDLRIAPAGDSALVVEFPQRIAPDVNARVLALAKSIRRRCGPSLRDVVIGYCTLTAFFDPLAVDAGWLEGELRQASTEMPDQSSVDSATVDVPVCYGGELGPDLGDVAAFGTCSFDDVVSLHAGEIYTVYLVGFVPGFAYMAEVNSRIAAPRRSSPRTAVPAGSVAIAGPQTGIYPTVTPGGWNIIGRTPVKPYDPSRAVPFLFQPGDRVRFRPVERAEFDRLS